MPLFFAIVITLPIVLAEFVDWRYTVAFWAVLFAGSGLLKLWGLGF